MMKSEHINENYEYGRPFFKYSINKFSCNKSFEEILEYLPTSVEIIVNDGPHPLPLDLIKNPNQEEIKEKILRSKIYFDLPSLDFDHNVAYGYGCGGDDIQYVLDFKNFTFWIVGSDISPSLGLSLKELGLSELESLIRRT